MGAVYSYYASDLRDIASFYVGGLQFDALVVVGVSYKGAGGFAVGLGDHTKV